MRGAWARRYGAAGLWPGAWHEQFRDDGGGHFVKMAHNGIEYGMMQAYAEGFEIRRAKVDFGLDLHAITSAWHYGSVEDSGEGRWTI